MSKSQILSNILHPIEFSYDYTEVPAGYSTFSIAYLIYSTSHWPTLDSRVCRPHGGRWMITKFIPKDLKIGGQRCGYPKHRKEAIDFPTPPIEAGVPEKRDQYETGRRRYYPKGRQKKSAPMMKENEEPNTKAEEIARQM